MVHNDDRGALVPQLVKHAPDHPFAGGIHPGERLIQQVEFWGLHQDAGHKHAAALAAGQFGDLPFGQVGNTHPVEDFHHPAAVGGIGAAQPAEFGVHAHGHHLFHGNGIVPVHSSDLWHVGHLAAHLPEGFAEKPHGTGVVHEFEAGFDNGGFASTVRAEKPHDGSDRHGEGGVFDGEGCPVGNGDIGH